MMAFPWKYAAAVAVVVGALYGAYHHGVTVTDTVWQSRRNDELAKANATIADLQAKARKVEQDSALSMQTIDNAYQQGRTDAQTIYDRTTAERDSGAILLRDRFTCPASDANGLPKASTATSQRDAGTARGLQRADESFLVREAKRADEVANQLRAAQQTIVSMQKTCGVMR